MAAGVVSADSQGLAKVPLAVTKLRTVILKQGSGCTAAPDGGGVGDGGATSDGGMSADSGLAGDGGLTGDAAATGDAGEVERTIKDGCGCVAAPGASDLALPGLLLLLALFARRVKRR